jgi:hypothetical protein
MYTVCPTLAWIRTSQLWIGIVRMETYILVVEKHSNSPSTVSAMGWGWVLLLLALVLPCNLLPRMDMLMGVCLVSMWTKCDLASYSRERLAKRKPATVVTLG